MQRIFIIVFLFSLTITSGCHGIDTLTKLEIDALLVDLEKPDNIQAYYRAGRYRISRAVPILERQLIRRVRFGKLVSYCVANSLYMIGNRRAHEVLSEIVKSDVPDFNSGIKLTLSRRSEMGPLADEFIRDYLLESSSDKISVSIEFPKKGVLRYIITNKSGEPISLLNTVSHHIAHRLLLEDPEGRFSNMIMRNIRVCDRTPRTPWITLKNGGKWITDLKYSIKERPSNLYRKGQHSEYIFNLLDVAYELRIRGEYKIYAYLAWPRREQEVRKRLSKTRFPDNMLTGNWISKPIKLKIDW